MNIQDVVFCGIAFITLLGAFLAVWLKNVFHNALALILCLFGVASLFIFLNAEFLAVIEVIIYIGAISVAIIFAIMLSKPWFHQSLPRNRVKVFRAVIASALLFGGLLELLRRTQWPVADPATGDFSMKAIGRSLLTAYALPFETVSLVLLIAIIGALVVSSSRESSS
jgi:NADH-quinone oxidoreductase subunit J